jgi:integrase
VCINEVAKGAMRVKITKRQVDALTPGGMIAVPRWTLHDLRRTGRSLMSRAKVPSDHAERVLGHVIGGVRETYDRDEYLDEKRGALTKLANLLQEIISQPKASLYAAEESPAQLAAA